MTFDSFWKQILCFLDFLICKPDGLSTGPREEGNNLLSTISLGFSFSGFQHAVALLPVIHAPRDSVGSVGSRTPAPRCLRGLLSFSPISNSGPLPYCPPKAKINYILNFHLCYTRIIVSKLWWESSQSILEKINAEHRSYFSHRSSAVPQEFIFRQMYVFGSASGLSLKSFRERSPPSLKHIFLLFVTV